MPIELPADIRKRLLQSIQHHAEEHLEQPIGELQAQLLMDLMLELVGSTIYNQAIQDAQAYLQGKLLDMEGDLHEG